MQEFKLAIARDFFKKSCLIVKVQMGLNGRFVWSGVDFGPFIGL